MKRILITGATSMIGLSLINECIKREIEVLALCRADSKKRYLIPSHSLVKVLSRDLNELRELNVSKDKKYDALIHLGWAYTDKASRNDPKLQLENINFTLEAVKLAKRAGCEKFVGAGSQAEYGRVEGRIKASQPPNPEISYGAAKYSAGVLSRILCNQIELHHNWARIFSVYGKNDGEGTLVSYLIRQMKEGLPCNLTPCEQRWDYLFADDCADALLAIAERGKSDAVYNIGSGTARPLKEYVETIRNALDAKSKINYGAIAYSDKQVMNLEADIECLKQDTGFSVKTSFCEGIKKIIAQ